jgi:DNA-binding beta-propeller fold protein YncE
LVKPIDEIKKKNINLKFVDTAERVMKTLPTKKAETLRVFTPLVPFVKIIGEEVPQIVGSIQEKIDSTTHIEVRTEPPAQEVKTTGSPFYRAVTSTEKESMEPIKKTPFEANPPLKTHPIEDKKSTEYQYKAEKKSSLNKWIIIVLPIILAGVIGIVVAASLQHPAPSPQRIQPTQPIQPTQQYLFIKKWGSQGTGDGQFDSPEGIAVDSSGSVYVADSDNNRVQKFSSDGTFITKWGSSGTADGQFGGPEGIAVDSSGSVYVADRGNDRVQKFDSDGTFITKWGSSGTADGQFGGPYGIGPNAVAVDSKTGNVYVADPGNDRVQKFDSNGTFITKWGSSGTADRQFLLPEGVAVDSKTGNVYVTQSINDRVQKFDSNGTFITKWGSQGTTIGLLKGGSANGQFSSFNRQQDVAVDSKTGNVYVTDPGNYRIQKFDSNGTFITTWGSHGSANGQFSCPSSASCPTTMNVAVDSKTGNVYVADPGNYRIQVFSPAS